MSLQEITLHIKYFIIKIYRNDAPVIMIVMIIVVPDVELDCVSIDQRFHKNDRKLECAVDTKTSKEFVR